MDIKYQGKIYEYIISIKEKKLWNIEVKIMDEEKVVTSYKPHGLDAAISSIIYRESNGGTLTDIELDRINETNKTIGEINENTFRKDNC